MCELIFALYVRNPHRGRSLLHVHGDVDNFVDELQLDESPRFSRKLGICLCNLTGTTIILSMCCFLWALGVYGKLFVLCLDLVSFSAPSF